MIESDKSPIVDRLIKYIEYTGLSSTQFADKAGIPRPSLSQILHGRNKSLNNQLLEKLNLAFPSLNVLWLLFNQGEMLTRTNIEFSEHQNVQNQSLLDFEDAENYDFTNDYATENEQNFSEENRINQQTPPQTSTANIQNAIQSSINLEPSPIDVNKPNQTQKQPDNSSANHQVTIDKKISSIIVLYSDGSFETFKPNE